MKVICTAPTRVDLAGATLDLWPIQHLLDDKATINFAVSLLATSTISLNAEENFSLTSLDLGISVKGNYNRVIKDQNLPLLALLLKVFWPYPEVPLTISTSADSPKGAGLGGSSALAICYAKGLNYLAHKKFQKPLLLEHELLAKVRDCEARIILAPTGEQDYWAALRGGLNIIEYDYGSTQVKTYHDCNALLEDCFTLCYTGQSRESAENNWEIYKSCFLNKESKTLAIFAQIAKEAVACKKAIESGSLTKLWQHSLAEWQLRCKLWPNIATPISERIDAATKKAGAVFSRVCGAGGGGVMAIFHEPQYKAAIKNAIDKSDGQWLYANLYKKGVEIDYYES